MVNDIDIYNDIEIIISTKSLGNIDLDLLFDANKRLDNKKIEIYCNYFKNIDSMKDEPKFCFRNIKCLDKNFNLNYPIEFHNTFLDLLNNHIFLYLQTELYYYICFISQKLSDEKNKNENNLKNFKIFKNNLEQEDFYLNITKICSLFFFCFDSLNSIKCLNSVQENMIQNEIDNFKYTLIDLITIYSKYGCKIKSYFLSLFVEKINEKKYFDLCLFVLTYEFYEINNNEVFDILFNYLNNISIEYCDNNQIKQLFIKLIDFDQIYLSKEIKKSTKKEYSKLIRNLIKKIIEDQLSDCYRIFRKKLKKLKKDLENNNMNNSFSEIKEEDYCNEDDKKAYKISFDETNKNNSNDNNNNNILKFKSRKFSSCKNVIDTPDNVNNNELEDSEKNLEMLILLYKNLKNLYVSINDLKKKFIELFADRMNFIKEFFNELFNTLCEIYPIKEEDNQNLKFELSENEKKEVIIAELIKCLCIRFLDDLFFEENIKKIREEELKKQKNDEKDSRKGSSGSLKNSFNSCKATIKSNPYSNSKKGSFKSDNTPNNLINIGAYEYKIWTF